MAVSQIVMSGKFGFGFVDRSRDVYDSLLRKTDSDPVWYQMWARGGCLVFPALFYIFGVYIALHLDVVAELLFPHSHSREILPYVRLYFRHHSLSYGEVIRAGLRTGGPPDRSRSRINGHVYHLDSFYVEAPNDEKWWKENEMSLYRMFPRLDIIEKVSAPYTEWNRPYNRYRFLGFCVASFLVAVCVYVAWYAVPVAEIGLVLGYILYINVAEIVHNLRRPFP